MTGLYIGAPKDRCLGALAMAVVCGPLLAALCFAAGQMPGFEQNVGSRKKVTLIVHVQRVNSIAPSSAKHVQVIEHGKTLQVVDGPRSAGPKQIALLLDANFHQRKVLAVEQQTAGELLSEIEKEDAQALMLTVRLSATASGRQRRARSA